MIRLGRHEDFTLGSWEHSACAVCKERTYVVENKNLNLASLGFTKRCGAECFWYSTSFNSAIKYYEKYGEADAELLPVLKQLVEKKRELFNLSYATTLDMKPPPTNEGFTFRPEQLPIIRYCQLADNVLIADEMRLGKTFGVLGYLCTREFDKVLIVCPNNAKLMWEESCHTIGQWPVKLLKARDSLSPGINIVHYDIVHTIDAGNPDIFIADEAHSIKNLDARRTAAVFNIGAGKKIALDGTPILSELANLLVLIKWLSPKYRSFKLVGDLISDGKRSLNYSQLSEELRSFCMIRRIKTQVEGFDSEIKINTIPLECPEHLKVSKESLKHFSHYRKLIGLEKINAALDYLRAYEEKIVIFVHHREVADRLQASLGHRAATIYGGMTNELRKQYADDFRDSVYDRLICNDGVGGQALDMSSADRILALEFGAGMLQYQAMERCSGKNKKQVIVEILHLVGSLDDRMLSLLKSREVESECYMK